VSNSLLTNFGSGRQPGPPVRPGRRAGLTFFRHRQAVLLIEPAAEEATIKEFRLVAQGFDVQVARTATQAMEFLESATISFVLSEVELLTRWRQVDATTDVPFVFVARASDTAAIDRAFAFGAQHYVVKPTGGGALAAKLRRVSASRSRPEPSARAPPSRRTRARPPVTKPPARLQIHAGGFLGCRPMIRSRQLAVVSGQ
jgi:DNA-binding response OmpR family regulator